MNRYRYAGFGRVEFLSEPDGWIVCAIGFDSEKHAENWVRIRNERKEWKEESHK